MFAGKATGLGPLVATIGSLGGAIVTTTAELFGMVGAFGIAETATYAMQTAWASFNVALVAYPAAFALAGLAAGFYVLYHALETDVAQAEKLGGVAVTWSDQWAAAVANTTARLAGLKKILQDMLPGSEGSITQDVKAFNAIPTFGQRAEQIAQQRAKEMSTPKVKAPEPVVAEPTPSPSTKPAKPDPYQAELAKLNTELKNSQLTLNAAMQDSVDAQRAATEAGKAGLIVTALQTKLKRDLTSTERAAITNAVRDTGENEHNASVVDSLRQRTDASKAALATTQALAAVVGQGASAEQAAKQAVDLATLARTIGAEAAQRYASRLSDLSKIEEQAARAARELETTQKAFDLRQSAADADALALATLRGADAVEQETLQLKLNAIVRAHRGDDVATTQALIAATVEQAEAERRLQDVRAGQKLVSPAAQYAKAIDDINRLAADARAAGVEIDQTQVWLADRDAALQYQAALEKIHAVSGTLGDGVKDYFTDMLNGAISTATAVKDVLGEAFSGLNENLSKLMTGQKTAWASMFRGIGESIAKMGLQKVETSIATAIVGPGKSKDDHTDPALHQTNTLLTDVNAILHTINSSILTKESAPATGNATGGVEDAITGASSSGDGMLGGLASAALSMIPGAGLFSGLLGGLFGGHRALGGNVQAGMSYDVGEMGRETFVPSTNGTIVPNNKLSGGGINYTVQVANGVTPEQMSMHVRQALQEYHPHVVRASVQAVQDHAKRGASSGHN